MHLVDKQQAKLNSCYIKIKKVISLRRKSTRLAKIQLDKNNAICWGFYAERNDRDYPHLFVGAIIFDVNYYIFAASHRPDHLVL